LCKPKFSTRGRSSRCNNNISWSASGSSSSFNPIDRLDGSVCGPNQILLSDGADFACANPSSVPGAGVADAITTSATEPVGAVEGDIYYNTGDQIIYSYDGTDWNASNDGGTASEVPATGVTPGTLQFGVVLPASQLGGTINPNLQIASGALASGVTIAASQITSGTLNPIDRLDGSVCGPNQVLLSNGTDFVCANMVEQQAMFQQQE